MKEEMEVLGVAEGMEGGRDTGGKNEGKDWR